MQLIQHPVKCCVHSALREDQLRPRSSGKVFFIRLVFILWMCCKVCWAPFGLGGESDPRHWGCWAPGLLFAQPCPAVPVLVIWSGQYLQEGNANLRADTRRCSHLSPANYKTLLESTVKGSGFVPLSLSETFELVFGLLERKSVL